MIESALHRRNKVLTFEGLEQVVVRAATHGINGYADVVNGSNHDDRQAWVERVNALQ